MISTRYRAPLDAAEHAWDPVLGGLGYCATSALLRALDLHLAVCAWLLGAHVGDYVRSDGSIWYGAGCAERAPWYVTARTVGRIPARNSASFA